MEVAQRFTGHEILPAWPPAYSRVQRLEQERESSRELRAHQAQLEDQIKDALLRNQQYEGGVYGLPQVRAPACVSARACVFLCVYECVYERAHVCTRMCFLRVLSMRAFVLP